MELQSGGKTLEIRLITGLDQGRWACRREERKYQDEFNTEHMPEERMEYEDSVPMDRRPTLPVADVLGAERQEHFLGECAGFEMVPTRYD